MYTKVKFKEGTNSAFYKELNELVEQYFSDNKISRFANVEMIFKTSFILFVYVSLYILLLLNEFNAATGILFCIILGFIHPLIFINIGHDAMHQTYSKKRKVNQSLAYLLNLIGLNAYINKFLHLRVHHNYASIEGVDIILEEYSILRLSDNQPYMNCHKYQKIYAPFIYSLFAIFLIFQIDFTLLKRKRMGNLPVKHARVEVIKLYLVKIFYLLIALILPLIFIESAWYNIVGGFFLVHFISGFVLAMVGVLNHQIDESIFPLPNPDGYILNNKQEHELEVTIDFAPYSKLALWYFGGFNTHAAHHLFPHICHVHYIPITRLIEETSLKYGLRYQKKTLIGAIKSHFKYLDRLSHPPERFRNEIHMKY